MFTIVVFIQFLGSQVTKAVTKPFSVPDGDEGTLSKIATKKFVANAKNPNASLQALNDDDTTRVIHCKSAHEIWSHLVITHEGIHKSSELRLISRVPNMKILL